MSQYFAAWQNLVASARNSFELKNFLRTISKIFDIFTGISQKHWYIDKQINQDVNITLLYLGI